MSTRPVTFDANEAGQMIGKSENWMKTQARQGKIPCTRPGRSFCWTAEQLAEILRMFEHRPRTATLPAPRSTGKRKDDGSVPLLKSKPVKRNESAA